MLKLPKDLLADPRHDALAALLSSRTSLLWDGGRLAVAKLPMTGALGAELRVALTAGLAVQGLEAIETRLQGEQKGLDAVKNKTPEATSNPRVSRVLFFTNDGSTRFYRDCEALLSRYAQRILGCQLDVSGDELGGVLATSKGVIRSVLVVDKKVAARSLLALVPAS